MGSNRHLLWILICLALLLAAEATAQSRYSYLVEATNRILALNARGSNVDSAEAAAAARQACDALGILLKDQQFHSDLKTWAGAQFNDQRLAFKRDLGLFLDSFLMPEKGILREAGFDDNAVERILMSAATVHASLDVNVRPDQIIKNIESLRAYLCFIASRLDGLTKKEELTQMLRRWAAGLAGVSLIVADVPLTPQGPLAVVAVVSVTLGGILLDRAVAVFRA